MSRCCRRGAAGLSAASAAKRLRGDALDVVVFERSAYISYGACSEPYYVSGIVPSPEDLVSVSPETFERRRGIHIRRLHEVEEIDRVRGRVRVRDLTTGRRSENPYDQLMLATGARPVMLGVPGEDLPGVCTLRTVEDAVRVRRFALEADTVVVCGGGYIGLEMAEAFVTLGKHVVVLKKSARMLFNFDPEMSALVEEEVRRHGVEIRTGVDVQGFEGGERVRAVVTGEGNVPCGAVLVAKGAMPEVALARGCGVGLGDTGAVAVDRRQQTGDDHIWAAGDCAESWHRVLGRPAWIPLGTTANKTGRIAGENIGGRESEFAGMVGSAASKIFDLEVARTGLSLDQAREAGFDARATLVTHASRSGHYPGRVPLAVQVVAEQGSGRLLGAQMVGREGAAHRIGVFAAALYAGMSVDDVYRLDLAYAPPFSPVWDPILVAAGKARGR